MVSYTYSFIHFHILISQTFSISQPKYVTHYYTVQPCHSWNTYIQHCLSSGHQQKPWPMILRLTRVTSFPHKGVWGRKVKQSVQYIYTQTRTMKHDMDANSICSICVITYGFSEQKRQDPSSLVWYCHPRLPLYNLGEGDWLGLTVSIIAIQEWY